MPLTTRGELGPKPGHYDLKNETKRLKFEQFSNGGVANLAGEPICELKDILL